MATPPFDIKQAVIRRRDACAKFKDGQPARDRREAMDFYQGKNLALYGDSGAGLSTVVSRDTMEAIESMMPPLLRPFVAGEEVVSFDPIEAQDEESTKQCTEFVNHVFRRDNNVLDVAQTALKDGLLLREGIAKTVLEEEAKGEPERLDGLDEQMLQAVRTQLVAMGQDVAGDIEQDPATGLYSVTVPPKKVNRYRVHIIAPGEFLREEGIPCLSKGGFFGDRHEISVGDLIDQGVDPVKAKLLKPGRPERDDDHDAEDDEDSSNNDWKADDLARMVWVDECYIRCDYNGTGTLEWRKVLMGGANNILLSDEPSDAPDGHPYSHWTPVPIPHRLTGLSMHDLTRDIQMNKTAMQREINNAMYLANRPQREVLDGMVNVEDLLQPQVGGLVRVKQMGAVNTMVTGGEAPLAAGFQAIEYLDGVREARTGVTRYNQGMDANSLNKTATGMNIISNNSQQRQELVARQFGEFLKDIFQKILGLVSRHAAEEEVVKLRGQFLPWPTDYDMTVSVGLGTNNKDQTVAHVMALLQLDERIIQMQGGLNGPLVTAQNLFEKLKLLTQGMGFKGNDRYYTDPAQAQEMQQQQPPEDPLAETKLEQETELQKEAMRQQTEMAKEQMRQQPVVVPINMGAGL